MGMQCRFNIKDLPSFTKVVTYSYESESYNYEVVDGEWDVDCNKEGDAWFDIGSCHQHHLDKIAYLIKNRVNFNCS